MVKLALYDDENVVLVYPGEVDCCKHLLRTLRQMATNAMIDGVPYRQYWGELLGANEADSWPSRAIACCARRTKRKSSVSISC